MKLTSLVITDKACWASTYADLKQKKTHQLVKFIGIGITSGRFGPTVFVCEPVLPHSAPPLENKERPVANQQNHQILNVSPRL